MAGEQGLGGVLSFYSCRVLNCVSEILAFSTKKGWDCCRFGMIVQQRNC